MTRPPRCAGGELRALPDLCFGIVSGRLETQVPLGFLLCYETRTLGSTAAFFNSLCFGRHRTKAASAALVGWSCAPQPALSGANDKSRPVASHRGSGRLRDPRLA